MQEIGDILQTLARQRARGDAQPLILLHPVDSISGERVSHLPIDSDLAQAWVALTGEPFRPHQAQALTALRRGEPVGLQSNSAGVAMTAYLLLFATLVTDPSPTTLLVAPNEDSSKLIFTQLTRLNEDLPFSLRISATVLDHNQRPNPFARAVVTSPELLHNRLLRHHDRAWQSFLSRLRLVVLPDIHHYNRVASAHLADLLLRLQRIAARHSGYLPQILATLFELSNAELTLQGLLGQEWRLISADDIPHGPTTLAVWQSGPGRLRDSVDIATALHRQGYRAHIMCTALESAAILPMVSDLPNMSVGPVAPPAQILVVSGYPGSQSALQRMLRSGYQAVIITLGEQPHEQALAYRAITLLDSPPTSGLPVATNAYVTAQQLLCAANEMPLTEGEVEAWGAQDIVARLVEQGHFVDLPDSEVAWKPTDAAGDPYADYSVLSASGGATLVRNEQGYEIDKLDPAMFDRWAFVNAALPPGAGGLRVLERDEALGIITVRLEGSGRRSYPLRRCEVAVRDVRETRTLPGGQRLGWGRVLIDEEIYGYRELTPGKPPAETTLPAPLSARWVAPACWFDLPLNVQAPGQFVGWCLAAALPLRTQASIVDVVPCYDHVARRLYIVDAQPSGSGVAAWIYSHAEPLLPLAYDIALACRNDPLLEPLCRVDMDWLLALLGRTDELVTLEAARRPKPARAPLRLEPSQAELREGVPRPSPLIAPTPPREIPFEREWTVSSPSDRGYQLEHPSSPAQAGDVSEDAPPPSGQQNLSQPASGHSSSDRGSHTRRPSSAAPAQRSNAGGLSRQELRKPIDHQPSRPVEASGHDLDRSSDSHQRTPPPNLSGPPEEPPDAAAMIARLRRQREQREASRSHRLREQDRRPNRQRAADSTATPRFNAGERIFCLPYGDGVVRSSRIEEGHEILRVAFPDHGELTIDPAVSLVRKIEDQPHDEDSAL